jgi:lipopolysaccharide export system permease protein
MATKAQYIPPGEGTLSGGWLLTGTTPAELDPDQIPSVLESIDPGKYFLHVRQADFEVATRPRQWYTFASTAHLYALLTRSDSPRMAPLAVQFHMRLTRPILGFLLVYLGLALILRDQNMSVFISAGLCLVMCATFFGVIFACKQLGDSDIISPALAAWLPVLLFGPPAIAMYDAIHT